MHGLAPLLCVVAGVVALAARPTAPSPRITVTPDTALYDEAVHVSVTGLRPGDTAAVHASTRDAQGRRWTSWAEFVADARGAIDVDAQMPARGSYGVADGMGLFWSMALDSAPAPSAGAPPPGFPRTRVGEMLAHPEASWGSDTLARWLGLEGTPTRLELRVGGRTVAAADVVRRLVLPGTRVTMVRERGLVGVLFEPPGAGARATVVTLPGAGSTFLGPSPLFAAHGFTTLALAYYLAPGLPAQLVEIPLEYVDTALVWLRTRPAVDTARIGVVGWSTGGELALLVASLHPEIRAVIGMAPSGVVWERSIREQERLVTQWSGRSTWTYRGVPVPFLRRARAPADAAVPAETDASRLMRAALADSAAVARAAIPVERSRAAFLLVTARDDPAWPSTALSEIAIARLRRAHYARPFEHLVYDIGLHGVALDPYQILQLRPETAAQAVRNRRDAWARELRFLEDQLARR